MALKKPSEYFKKDIATVNESVQELVKTPELNTFSDAFESFKNNLSKIEVLSEFSDTLDNYRVNIEKVNYLSEKVEDIQTEVQTLLKKEDLDRAMMSQLLVVEQSIRDVQSKVKGINEKNLTEIRLDVSGLTESVNEFLELEVPKYKKLIVDSEIRTNNRYEELEENVNRTLEGIGEFVDDKYQELTESLQGINEQSLASIIEDFKSLDKIVFKLKEQEIPKYKGFIVETERKTESKLNEFQDKLDETVNSILEKVDLIEGNKIDLVDVVNQKIKEIKNVRDYVVEDLKNSEEHKKQISKKVTDLEAEIVRNELHIKKQNQNLEQIQENVRSTIQKLNLEELEEKNYELGKKVKYLEEVFEKFNEKEILTENIIVEPPSTDNKDPLTPLDQNFVTLDQLQQHYRLFINRIQQQLATIGGGGETRLEFLDDVDRNSAKQNGYVLQYNSSVGKFIGTSYVPGGGGGTGEISIQQDNVVVGTAVTVLNFSGLGISSVTASAGIATINVGGSTRNVSTYTATEGQTTFAATYTVGFVDVFLNGSKLSQTQYIASNGTSVFLTEGASADDIVEIVSYDTLQIVPTTVSNFIVRDEGTLVGASVTSLNFVGTGVSASVIGNDATITIQGGGSGESYWASTTAGIHTLSNVGIGTTNPTAKLFVEGDARITGILSVGQGTVTINGITNTVNVDNLVVGTTLTGPGGVGYATVGYVTQQISNLVDGAPAALDTLNELAAALNDDENFATTVTNSLALKAPINNANLTGVTTTATLNVGVGGTIITTTGIGSVGIGSTLPGSTLVVNAPSGYTGNVLDAQVGGTSKVSINQNGTLTFPPVTTTLLNVSTWAHSLESINNNTWNFKIAGANLFALTPNEVRVTGSRTFGFSSSEGSVTALDVILARDSANVLAQRNAGAAQTFRVYNTYTSASQYERAYLGWNNNTFQIGVDTAGISTARSISLVGAAGSNTGDTLQPLQINQTWTAGSGIATALTLNVTDTSSSSSSNLLDLRVDGSSKIYANKFGSLTANGLIVGSTTQTWVSLGSGFARLASNTTLSWSGAVNNASFTQDLILARDAANVLAQRNAGIGQTFRIYNTYTSATNFERANVGWTTNTFIVGTEKGSAGGTARQLELQTDGTTRVAITTTGNVGIGSTQPTAKLDVVGDVRVGVDTSQGLILTSPNGTKFRLSVDDSGNLTTTPV